MDIGVTVGASVDRIEETVAGFDFVELSIPESGGTPTNLDEDHLRTAVNTADADLFVHLPFEQVLATPVSRINAAIVDYLTGILAWAGGVGARKAVVHGTVRNPHNVDQRPIVADQLGKIVAAGDDVNVEVVVENVGHQKRGLQLSVLGDISREVDASVCFDVGHAYMEDGNDGVKRFLRRYGALVSHLHVHDVRRRGDTHIPIGAGEVDFAIVANQLADFDGSVAVEVFTDDLELLRDSAHRISRFFDGY